LKEGFDFMLDNPDPANLVALRAPILQAALETFAFHPGSHGLDVGCGDGSLTLLLAGSVLPAGSVTGVDLSAEQIARARDTAAGLDIGHHVSFREGDMRDLPFEDDSFDWTWSLDCVGYVPVDPLPVIDELVRVVRTGGKIATLVWSSQQLLPGYPSLEARLNGTSAGIAPFQKGSDPANHFMRTLGWFRAAGLENVSTQTFVRSIQAPLDTQVRAELHALLNMRWSGVLPELSAEYRAVYTQICDPESPAFILNLPDYVAFFTYTLFQGNLPKG
jgi:demethylmenaquinone methyltransferase/2-methoxy-6-polyprenyl-1,4-benzoquinol methylase